MVTSLLRRTARHGEWDTTAGDLLSRPSYSPTPGLQWAPTTGEPGFRDVDPLTDEQAADAVALIVVVGEKAA